MEENIHEGSAQSESSGAAEAVRRAFDALPLDQKVSTLCALELNLIGDIADGVIQAANRAAGDLADAFNDLFSPPPRPSEPGTPV